MEGPACFAANRHWRLGGSHARRQLLQSRGLSVCSVPAFEWAGLPGLAQQQAYLAALLAPFAQQRPASVSMYATTSGIPASAGLPATVPLPASLI